MRLLNMETSHFKDFVSSPPRLILSHTWSDEEVNFLDRSEPDKNI